MTEVPIDHEANRRAAFNDEADAFMRRAAEVHGFGIVIMGGVDLVSEGDRAFTISRHNNINELKALIELTEIQAEQVYARKLKVQLVEYVTPPPTEPSR